MFTPRELKVEAKNPWELAETEGKTVIVRLMGPMIGVYYPYRKSGDLYVGSIELSIHCCQCDAPDFESKDFLDHIRKHNRAKRKYPGFIIDPELIEEEAPCSPTES